MKQSIQRMVEVYELAHALTNIDPQNTAALKQQLRGIAGAANSAIHHLHREEKQTAAPIGSSADSPLPNEPKPCRQCDPSVGFVCEEHGDKGE